MCIQMHVSMYWCLPHNHTHTSPTPTYTPYVNIDETAGSLLEANTRITAGLGTTVTAKEAMATDKLRRYAFDYITKTVFKNVDVIVSPTLPMLPPLFPKGRDTGWMTPYIRLLFFLFLSPYSSLFSSPALTLLALLLLFFSLSPHSFSHDISSLLLHSLSLS